ncbi:transcriptional regulator [Pseudomonas tohonis]|uniref:Transcriptional regulator n=1 Tax=Pseudomonas tohonis TaxID=2725477 RepID=A0A6J4EC62_9PSED|nr:nuclear transport factor 2 family protein [Pseudomonas tohonis]BCG26949.1 transcriptional regulator [Pseudomonas tohonis]GJN50315.1 transcriptional regulator [Pseudomonas tohonis]
MSAFLHRFAEDFARLDRDNLALLDTLYSEDAQFTDPLHHVEGLPAIRQYFAGLYENVSDLSFRFHGHDPVGEGEGYLRWTMTYRHPRLDGGRPIAVEGCSHLRWGERVHYHRDYFDAGALLYEHVPLLRGAIALLKRRLG